MRQLEADGLRAVLDAYERVATASWPQMHPDMARRAARRGAASEAELRTELETLVRESSSTECGVRVFWKLGEDYRFGGCNVHFARDAGFGEPTELDGIDDFDRRLPWTVQAAKYRADDQSVFRSGEAKLDIVERQQSTTGITWVRAGKAPIRHANGSVLGVLGMYEILDPAVGRKLWAERLSAKR